MLFEDLRLPQSNAIEECGNSVSINVYARFVHRSQARGSLQDAVYSVIVTLTAAAEGFIAAIEATAVLRRWIEFDIRDVVFRLC